MNALRCIDCEHEIGTGLHYGAGTGDGQRFRCAPCHERNEENAWLFAVLEEIASHADCGDHVDLAGIAREALAKRGAE